MCLSGGKDGEVSCIVDRNDLLLEKRHCLNWLKQELSYFHIRLCLPMYPLKIRKIQTFAQIYQNNVLERICKIL